MLESGGLGQFCVDDPVLRNSVLFFQLRPQPPKQRRVFSTMILSGKTACGSSNHDPVPQNSVLLFEP